MSELNYKTLIREKKNTVNLPDLKFGDKTLNLTPKGQATKDKKKREIEHHQN